MNAMCIGNSTGPHYPVPTKFVNGQNEGARPEVMQAIKGDILVVGPQEFAETKAVFPKPKFT